MWIKYLCGMRNEHVLQMNIQTFQSLLIFIGKNKLTLYVTRKDFSLKRILDWWNFLFFLFFFLKMSSWKHITFSLNSLWDIGFETEFRMYWEVNQEKNKKGRGRWRGKKTERRIVKCNPSPKGSTHFWHNLRQVWERAWEKERKRAKP